MKKIVLFLVFVILIFFLPDISATSVSTDRADYNYGDILKVTGQVSAETEGQFVVLQVINPTNSDIVIADQFLPSTDGSFSKTYLLEGPKLNLDGTYTLKIFDGEWFESTFQFSTEVESDSSSSSSTSKTSSDPPTSEPPQDKPRLELGEKEIAEKKSPDNSKKINPKIKILEFLDHDQTPQHYFDRYNNEPTYKEWFDTSFPNQNIEDVLGYTQTHIPGFPDDAKSPQYYLDRFSNEPEYQEWFESQFPNKSIYEVLGFPKSFFQKIPDWIKSNAEWWSNDLIDDLDFLSGIEYMIQEQIIFIPDIEHSQNSSNEKVPNWIKSNAGWWADNSITEDEFVNGIRYLIEKGIITVGE